jgi:acetylornithine deacetylase/succinyl-diaminopimelate desuccinylase-like protein
MASIPRLLRRSAFAAVLIAAHTIAAEPVAHPAPADNVALAREVLAKLIALKPTHANGSTQAAQYVADTLIAAGFAKDDVQVLIPAGAPDKGNAVVRLRGKGSARPLLYIGHLDVVEAKREDWNHDPFALTEQDGWLYGRGTIDMLGQDAAMLASIVRLKKEGFAPARDIIIAFTADEEGGATLNGVQWLLKEHRPLVDAELAINPDGGEAALKNGRKLYVSVQTSEKMYVNYALEATDKGGHSSRPTSANPIYRLARGLQRLSSYQFPAHLTDTTRLYFASRAALEQGQVRADMLAVSGAKPAPAALARLSKEVETNILLRTTCVATKVEGGHADNALPQRARATVQCRVMPGETQAGIESQLRKVMADEGIKVSVAQPATPSPESAPTPAILSTLGGVMHAMWPGVAVVPNMSPGASDSIHTRGAGIPTYGIDAMFDDLDDARAHGRDERISVPVFGEEVEFTYRLMKALSQ